jgi:hypothetical protein
MYIRLEVLYEGQGGCLVPPMFCFVLLLHVTSSCHPHTHPARTAWCLLIHADASLSLSAQSSGGKQAEVRPWVVVMSVDRGTVNYSAPEVLRGVARLRLHRRTLTPQPYTFYPYFTQLDLDAPISVRDVILNNPHDP